MRALLAGLAVTLFAAPAAAQEVREVSGNWTTFRCNDCAWDLYYQMPGTPQAYIRMTCVGDEGVITVRHPQFVPDEALRGGRLEVDGRRVYLRYFGGGDISLGSGGTLEGQPEGRLFMNAIRQRRPASIVIQQYGGGEYRFQIPATEDLAPLEAFYRRCGW